MKNTISSNIEEVQAHNLEVEGVQETQKELKNIQTLLKNQLKAEKGLSKFIDDNQTQDYLERLNLNQNELKAISEEIHQKKQNFQIALSTIFLKIKESENLYASKEINLNAKIEEFIKLNPKAQLEFIKELQKDIEKRKETLNQILNICDTKKLKSLDQNERESYLKESQKVIDTIKNITKGFPKTEAYFNEKAKFQDLSDNKKMLAKLKRRSSKENPLNQEFPLSNKKYSQKYAEYIFRSEKIKKQILEEIRNELKKEYTDKILKEDALAKKDKEIMLDTIKAENFDINLVITCIEFFDSSVKIAKECNQFEQETNPKILNHFNWQNIGSFERRSLIRSKQIEKYSGQLCHIEMDSQFEKYFKNNSQIIQLSKSEQKEIFIKFQNLELKLKAELLNYLNITYEIISNLSTKKTQPFYTRLLNETQNSIQLFSKLNEEDKHNFQKDFTNGSIQEKQAILLNISKQEGSIFENFKTLIEKKAVFKGKFLTSFKKNLKNLGIIKKENELNNLVDKQTLISKTINQFKKSEKNTKVLNLFEEKLKYTESPKAYEELFQEFKIIKIYEAEKITLSEKNLKKFEKENNSKMAIETLNQLIEDSEDPKKLKIYFKKINFHNSKIKESDNKEKSQSNSYLNSLLNEFLESNEDLKINFEKIKVLHKIKEHKKIQNFYNIKNTEGPKLDIIENKNDQDKKEIFEKHIKTIDSINKETQLEYQNENGETVEESNFDVELNKNIEKLAKQLRIYLIQKFEINQIDEENNFISHLKIMLMEGRFA